jgi:integrase
VMRAGGEDNDAVRLRGLIIVLWRAGLRISEALALKESDLDLHRDAILVRHGKAGKRRRSACTAASAAQSVARNSDHAVTARTSDCLPTRCGRRNSPRVAKLAGIRVPC